MAIGAPRKDTVSVAGIVVDSFKAPIGGNSWSIISNQDNTTIRTISINLARSVDSVLTMDETLNGSSVTVQRGVLSATEAYIFRGEVTKVIPNGASFTLICSDKLYRSTKAKINKSYDKNIDPEGGKFSEIMIDMLTNFAKLNADSSSVQDSGTGYLLTKFVCRSASVFDRAKKLTDTLGWQLYYNPVTDKTNYEPVGFVNQGTIIATGTNIVKTPKWDFDATNLFNKIEVRGAQQEVETTESGQVGVTTGYTTTSITLTERPNSTKVFADAANPPTTLRKGGVPSSTETFDYSVDQEEKLINWNTGTYQPSTNDFVEVRFSTFRARPVIVKDSSSIATYSDGLDDDGNPIPKEITLHKTDIIEVEDAEVFANQFLSDHKDPIKKTTIEVTNVGDLAVGQKVTINDTANNVSGDFFVTSVRMSSPYKSDKITVVSNILNEDSYDWNINQRVNRLEEKEVGINEVLLQTFDLDRDLTMQRRFTEVVHKDRSGDGVEVFILGHETFGVLGTQELGDTNLTWTTVKIVQGDNTYKEYFIDQEFVLGASTATLDTTNNRMVF